MVRMTDSSKQGSAGVICRLSWTHRWQRSPLMPLVVQKHLPLLGLHMLAWPLHLQAGATRRNRETGLKQQGDGFKTTEGHRRLCRGGLGPPSLEPAGSGTT